MLASGSEFAVAASFAALMCRRDLPMRHGRPAAALTSGREVESDTEVSKKMLRRISPPIRLVADAGEGGRRTTLEAAHGDVSAGCARCRMSLKVSGHRVTTSRSGSRPRRRPGCRAVIKPSNQVRII